MKFNALHTGILVLAMLMGMTTFTACTDDSEKGSGQEHPTGLHTKATTELIKICNTNPEVKRLLSHAIAQAAEINPDRDYNPAQTLTEFYDFVDWNVRQLPWDVMIRTAPNEYGRSLYGRTDQGIGYFWFVVDQPLDELRDRGYFYPTVWSRCWPRTIRTGVWTKAGTAKATNGRPTTNSSHAVWHRPICAQSPTRRW